MGDDPVRDAPLGGGDGDGRAELERLRELILGPERADLDDLARRLDDDEVRAQELADVLPDAVRLGAAHDRADLTDALSEPVAEAMHRSVREDPGSLADALFPVMGPAIRRAIVETVRDMIESFNQAIEASLSWQGLRWRIEALRSGKSYAEVAILHSLVYRVEQLLLIHKETGLLLRQVVAPEVEAQDPDLVSGMLTAIRDFVKDSFGSADGDALDTFRVGELQVLIEDSPRAVLAAVVRGQPPRDLRSRLRATLEDLVGRYSRRLAEFEGDTAPFEGCDVLLEPCLVSRFSESRPQRRGLVRVVWGVVMAGLVALLAWWIVAAIDGRRWRRAVASLDAEPGIVVTADRREGGRRVVTGLRDPYSRVPSEVLAAARVDPSRVDLALEPYQSLEDAVLAARLRAAWAVPATVESLAVDDGVVTVTGEADAAWLAAARRNGAALGITGWRLEGLAITEDLALRREIEALESVRFLMILDSTRLVAESEARIDEVAERLARAAELAATLGEELDVVVSGHTDESGSESRNVRLSERRAQTVVDLLVARGLDPGLFSILGVGTAEYLEAEGDVDEAQLNRRVSLLIERRPAGSGVDMIGGPEVAN